MGIHGIFKEIGPGQRISLAKVAHDHYVTHNRPFRLAIDIAIWLFQIQAGKGGSNPALRTLYYRLLRLMTLNIHPLFVFDGPNKPLFKRNKRVGGGDVRVASMPEFLAKQLLKQFGFPWYVAPGEAEAECALLQREGVVDAVLSEDVDTLMFGSGVTMRNWSSENSSKTPTHVNVFRASETKDNSGLDRDGMILIALMSGGDYVVEGIPGCGPRLACDAARAGFGSELCQLAKAKNTVGLAEWRERLRHEVKTNESKLFKRRNTTVVIPDDFPNPEVLGYYTNPAISSAEKVTRLKDSLRWDLEIDFPALRTFAADAFDWRCIGGAKKFIKNLAPALLVRELRTKGVQAVSSSEQTQADHELKLVQSIHGKRNHSTTDGLPEYRVSFIPMTFVPIDLSIEDEDDEIAPGSGGDDPSDVESEAPWTNTQAADESGDPATKKRVFKPFHPDQPDKAWVMRSYLQIGCPLSVEKYESPVSNAKDLLKAKRATAAATKRSNTTKKSNQKRGAPSQPTNTMLAYARTTKVNQGPCASQKDDDRAPLRDLVTVVNATIGASQSLRAATQADMSSYEDNAKLASPNKHLDNSRPAKSTQCTLPATQRTPQRRKRPPTVLNSPSPSQRSIQSYYIPKQKQPVPATACDIINLLSSSPAPVRSPSPARLAGPSPSSLRNQFRRTSDPAGRDSLDYSPGKLPDTVTKRRKRNALKRHQTAPVAYGADDDEGISMPTTSSFSTAARVDFSAVEVMDLASPSHSRGTVYLPRTSPVPQMALLSLPIIVSTLADAVALPAQSEIGGHTSVAPHPTISAAFPDDGGIAAANSPLRRSPRQQVTKQRIMLRDSLAAAWKEVEADAIDLSGDAGRDHAKRHAKPKTSWRKSEVEVLDLTID